MNRTCAFLLILTLFIDVAVKPAPASDTGSAIHLTDMAGRTLTLPGPAQRIVTTFKPATLCLLGLGLSDRLVGVDTSSPRDPLQRAVFPGITKLPGVGRKSAGLNFETIVALEPDLVILYAQMDGPAVGRRLRTVGIPCVTILPETFDTIKASLDLMARAAGTPERAREVGDKMDQILTLLEQRLGSLKPEQKKRGYFASTLGFFNTTTANMIQHEIMTSAGVENVSKDLSGYFQNISPEQLVQWNPDLIMTSRYLPQSQVKCIANPALQRVTAIAENQLFRCPSSLAPWDFPSPLSVLAGLWLGARAYPERFQDVDINAIIESYHGNLFGKTLSEMGGQLDEELPL